jgi:hypothetical protein
MRTPAIESAPLIADGPQTRAPFAGSAAIGKVVQTGEGGAADRR